MKPERMKHNEISRTWCFCLGFFLLINFNLTVEAYADKCQSNDDVTFQCNDVQNFRELMPELGSIGTLKNLQIKNQQHGNMDLSFDLSGRTATFLNGIEKLDLSHVGLLTLDDESDFTIFGALRLLNISGCRLEKLESSFFSPTNVLENLDASRNELGELSLEFIQALPSLRFANFSKNAIHTIHNGSFEKSLELKYLDLGNNELRNVTFGLIPNLKFLNLNDNLIESLSGRDYAILPALQYLHLTANSLSHIEDGIFTGFDQLRLLNISNNSLNDLRPDMFLGLENLLQLHLGSNELQTLPKYVFKHVLKLQMLDLSSNSFKAFDMKTFQNLTSLRELYLQNNDIRKLSDQTFAGLVSLETLDLSQNSLTYFNSNVFGGVTLPNLRKLLLRVNNIKELHPLAFSSIPFLKYLSLENNSLISLDVRMFAPMRQLEKLYLGINLLEEIPEAILDNLNEVTDLHIDNNRLTFLNSGKDEILPKLKIAAIEGNPWQCLCLQEILDWLHNRNIEYVSTRNPYYKGEKPLCLITPVEYCIKDFQLVRSHHIVDTFEDDAGMNSRSRN